MTKEFVEHYIRIQGYTWTYEQILVERQKQRDGYYVSHTAKDVIRYMDENCGVAVAQPHSICIVGD